MRLKKDHMKNGQLKAADAGYGNIKSNYHFNRFMLRGKQKVAIEFGLVALAQNIRKTVAKNTKEGPQNAFLPQL